MPKTVEENSVLRLKKEIAEIESKLKTDASQLDERGVKLLRSRLSFLKERLATPNNAREPHDLNPGKKMGVLAIEQRRHPRYSVELPLDYSRTGGKETHGGIVANASEEGLLVYLPEVMRIGDFLKIEIFYANGLELTSINAVAKVVWYDLATKESKGEYRYGLQFESIEEKDLERLKTLLREVGK
jgi:hypothetical protein